MQFYHPNANGLIKSLWLLNLIIVFLNDSYTIYKKVFIAYTKHKQLSKIVNKVCTSTF